MRSEELIAADDDDDDDDEDEDDEDDNDQLQPSDYLPLQVKVI